MVGIFGGSADDVPSIRDYNAARKFVEKAKPWRSRQDRYFTMDALPLGSRRAYHKNVRMDGDDVIFRLYNTDVVTYCKDGRVKLIPYASMMTDHFAAKLAPVGVFTYFNCKNFHVVGVERPGKVTGTGRDPYRLYNVNQAATLTPDAGGWLVSPTIPFRKEVIDRAKAQAVLRETNYRDFSAWLPAVLALEQPPGSWKSWRKTSFSLRFRHPDREILGMLADRARWPELAQKVYASMEPRRVLDLLRERIYSGRDVHRTVSKPYLESFAELWRMRD